MTLPDDKHQRSPRDRFRNILSAEQEGDGVPALRRPTVVNLPKVGAMPDEPAPEAASKRAVSRSAFGDLSDSGFLRTFWTVGGILSIIANIALAAMLLERQGTIGGAGSATTRSAALAGAYFSLEQLDQAHIRANVPVQTSISMDGSIPVRTTTTITLARDALVRGAHVAIDASGLSIDAPANVTLPAGTSLEVNLDMVLPLQSAVPGTAEVPVDIAVKDTELHIAIKGLQDTTEAAALFGLPGCDAA